jgi:TetR/AcrR family transcriptional regulator, cholesterol catabolism regulator
MKCDKKLEEILTAAISLFSSKGYLQTSMADIANAVQLTKGGLYHYVDKKIHILLLLHNQMTDAFHTMFRDISIDSSDPKVKIAKCIKAHISLMKKYGQHIIFSLLS